MTPMPPTIAPPRPVYLSSVNAAELAGVTYRQLDYWSRTGALTASGCEAAGSGSKRRYTLDDVAILRVLGALSAHGTPSSAWRVVADALRTWPGPLTGLVFVNAAGQVTREPNGTGWVVDLTPPPEPQVEVEPAP